MTDLISEIIEGWKEGVEESRREKAARQLEYKTRLIPNFNFSPKEFYVMLSRNLENLRIPGLQAELVQMHESISGSAYRLYLMIARERFVYYACAAPFGTGFFFSWRFVDESRPAKWYHILFTILVLTLTSGCISYLLTGPWRGFLRNFGVEAAFDQWVNTMSVLLVFSAIWSLMRLAAIPGNEPLAIFLEKVPVLGRVFERFYRPETYYREDTAQMYRKAFDMAISETIEAVVQPKGVRQSTSFNETPFVMDMHQR